jgi:hypothetical protein
VRFADDELGLALEGTYTGKAMAALIADLGGSDGRERILFWNTCNARPLPVPSGAPLDPGRLPAEFLRYFRGVG